jgi:hypothetical protein
MFFTKSITKRFSVDAEFFTSGWGTFDFSFDISLKGDHTPRVGVYFHLFEYTIFEITIYNRNHKNDDELDVETFEYISPKDENIKGHICSEDKYNFEYKGYICYIFTDNKQIRQSHEFLPRKSNEVFRTKEEAEKWLNENW